LLGPRLQRHAHHRHQRQAADRAEQHASHPRPAVAGGGGGRGVRRLAVLIVVAGALLAPATPAFAHGGEAPDTTAYRTRITGISTPEKGLTVRTVEAGARLELSNETGHSVEVLGYSGEPYLDVRPDGTYQNVNSPAAYRNQTLTGDTPVPATADPTAPPSWRRISTSTTVRWHDQRTHWLSAGLPPQ